MAKKGNRTESKQILDIVNNRYANVRKLFAGKRVNKNPLTTTPIVEKRLFYVNNFFFESIDELAHYCIDNKVKEYTSGELEYYREFAGRKDVIKHSSIENSFIYSAVDGEGYAIYNNEKSIYKGEFVWEFNYGSIEGMYRIFRDKGVIFENDIYQKREESNKRLTKMFNMGKE